MPDQNRRQDFRIDDVLAMRDQLITKEEYDAQRKQPGIRSRQNAMLQDMVGRDILANDLKEALNLDLAKAIETLDAKLNYLIGVNMLNDANRSELKERPINLSVTGASFFSDTRYRERDFTQLSIMLPSFPPSILELIGTVTWVKQAPNKMQHVGVRFNFRSDDEESSIVKYVFQRHREHIRLQAKGE